MRHALLVTLFVLCSVFGLLAARNGYGDLDDALDRWESAVTGWLQDATTVTVPFDYRFDACTLDGVARIAGTMLGRLIGLLPGDPQMHLEDAAETAYRAAAEASGLQMGCMCDRPTFGKQSRNAG